MVGCRWVFTLKHKADESIDRCKGRLVAKSYTQTYGVDYTETFAPIAKLNTSLRAWFGRFAASMRKSGSVQSNSDNTLFLKHRKETGMLDCKPIDIPSEQNHKLGLYPDQVPTDKERYQRLMGKLIYLAHTRPNIAYAVSVVSQFMHSSSEDHMGVTHGKGLTFSKYGHTYVEGCTDADWAGSAIDRRSTSGYFTFVGGNLVTWRSKKQKVVSRSSAEAEYRGMAHGVCELLWLRRLLRDLGFGLRNL
ncbi:Seven transmembrane MLO family protein [Prunus dulcis]|uniref:Seven transmembrane MLO family protein n=1 Tax=Prunus dulcis TaxID=3755 RepID=A0A4Y1R767_PRUDU|nr:Seven transmembrane MLO family protein [Prunus dulcis]